MSAQQQFASTPKSPTVRISVANAARDGTGTIVDLYIPPAGGGRLDDVRVKGEGVTTAGMIRFFKWDGATYRLILERPVVAVAAPGVATQTHEDIITDLAYILQSGHKIGVATHNAEAFLVSVTRGGDF